MAVEEYMNLFRLTSLSLLIASGCSGAPYADVSGEVDGFTLGPLTYYWGGPFLIIADEALDCMESLSGGSHTAPPMHRLTDLLGF